MFKLILQLHAHKKGTGSSHNGRDSNAQRLGTKAHESQLVTDRQHYRTPTWYQIPSRQQCWYG